MGRLLIICCLATGFSLGKCVDEPPGPQPDKPIRAPDGYVPDAPPEPSGPPTPKAVPPPKPAGGGEGGGAAAAAHAPAAAEPEQPKCPKDSAALISAKVRPAPKDKKKRLELKLTAKSGSAVVTFKRITKTEDGTAEDVKAEGSELTALVDPVKAKAKLFVLVQCGWEDRTVAVTVDAKGATMKEVPPPPEPGYLSLAAQPGMKVSSGGKELGITPLRNVPLAPGKYELTLKPAKGKPRMVKVEIKSGETTAAVDKGK